MTVSATSLKIYAGMSVLAMLVAFQLAKPKSLNDQLLSAAYMGDVSTVKVALADKANPNATDWTGNTALMLASQWGHLYSVQVLLTAGADVNARTFQGTALNLTKDPEVAAALIAAGADPNATESIGNFTALFEATTKHEPELAQALIDHGADVNKPADDGFTPLMWAASHGDLKMTQLLIDAGADLNLRTKSGNTALRMAEEQTAAKAPDADAVVALLRSKGARD
jgi:ankyrin repeat protein